MILDERLEFADAADVSRAAGNSLAANTDVIDRGVTKDNDSNPTLIDLGMGEPVYFVLQVDTTFVGATATIQFQLASDSTADLATSRTNHIDTGARAVTVWVAKYTLVYPLPVEQTYERYLGLWITVATATVTTAKINAFLTRDPAIWRAYHDALTP